MTVIIIIIILLALARTSHRHGLRSVLIFPSRCCCGTRLSACHRSETGAHLVQSSGLNLAGIFSLIDRCHKAEGPCLAAARTPKASAATTRIACRSKTGVCRVQPSPGTFMDQAINSMPSKAIWALASLGRVACAPGQNDHRQQVRQSSGACPRGRLSGEMHNHTLSSFCASADAFSRHLEVQPVTRPRFEDIVPQAGSSWVCNWHTRSLGALPLWHL